MNTESMIEFARQTLEEGKQVLPMLFVDCKDEEIVVGISDFPDGDKATVMATIGEMFKDHEPQAITFLADSYVKQIDPEKGEKLDTSKRVRDQEGRQEALVMAALDREGNAKMTIQFYERKGGHISFAERSEHDSGVNARILAAFWRGALGNDLSQKIKDLLTSEIPNDADGALENL